MGESIIETYQQDLKSLRQQLKVAEDETDKKIIRQMISSTDYSLYWLKHGHPKQPNERISRLSRDQRTELRADIAIFGNEMKLYEATTHLSEENSRIVAEALRLLSKKQRECFISVHGSLNSFAETAELYGMAKGSVTNHMMRAQNKINKFLEEMN